MSKVYHIEYIGWILTQLLSEKLLLGEFFVHLMLNEALHYGSVLFEFFVHFMLNEA